MDVNGNRAFYVRSKNLPSSKNQLETVKEIKWKTHPNERNENKKRIHRTRSECLTNVWKATEIHVDHWINCRRSPVALHCARASDARGSSNKNGSLVNMVKPIFTLVTLLRMAEKEKRKSKIGRILHTDKWDRCADAIWLQSKSAVEASFAWTIASNSRAICWDAKQKQIYFVNERTIKIDWIAFQSTAIDILMLPFFTSQPCWLC